MEKNGQKIFFLSNIKFLRERRKMTQQELADVFQTTRARIAALEAGNTKAPQPEDYVNFSEYFKVSIDTLLKIDLKTIGELKLRELEGGNDVYIKGGNLRILAISVDKRNRENVEYVPIKAKAGYASGCQDPEYIADLPKYTMPNLPSKGTFRIFPITGDSMLPIPDGSEIVGQYVEDWSEIRPETPSIVVLNGNQDFVFKLVSLERDGTFTLKSLNSLYTPFSVEIDDVLEIWRFQSFTTQKFPEPAPDATTLLDAIRNLESKIDILGGQN